MIRNYENYKQISKYILKADVILIGAGAGLSEAAGLSYSGDRFTKNFSDFIDVYHFQDMYTAGFYPFDSLESYWGYWSKHIYHNRIEPLVGEPYKNLLSLISNKKHFVITTNVDHQFQKAGFLQDNIFQVQGDYGLIQCSTPCHDKTYPNEELVIEMVAKQQNLKIPTTLIPYCPKCGEPMSVNLRIDNSFVEDRVWDKSAQKYQLFLEENLGKKLLLLELGVGYNTPVIIKYPFREIVAKIENVKYICFNNKFENFADNIKENSIFVQEDINQSLIEIVNYSKVYRDE
ncbi:TPA: NAD-dependent deacetylase [Listeria monocytogenes]